jgi:calcineurin-like phosphoesterase family protein
MHEVKKVLTQEEYDNFFVTSDTHFYHNKDYIFASRGYHNPIVMTDDMIDIINTTVGKRGILLHLGDFCLNTELAQYLELIKKLDIGQLWLIKGNHNNPHGRLDYREIDVPYTILDLGDYFSFRFGKRKYSCSHFPYMVWDGMRHGVGHLCGHSHGTLAVTRPEDKTYKILDCGWDIHKKPLTIKEVNDILDSKMINNLHHA